MVRLPVPIIGIILLLFSSSCGSSKSVTTMDTPFLMIVFGESGGIMGAGDQYGLSKEGILLKTGSENHEPEMIRKIQEQKLQEIFLLAARAKSIEPIRQEPGNLNRKILIQTEDGYFNYNWHMPEDSIPKEITGLYRKLMNLTTTSGL